MQNLMTSLSMCQVFNTLLIFHAYFHDMDPQLHSPLQKTVEDQDPPREGAGVSLKPHHAYCIVLSVQDSQIVLKTHKRS